MLDQVLLNGVQLRDDPLETLAEIDLLDIEDREQVLVADDLKDVLFAAALMRTIDVVAVFG